MDNSRISDLRRLKAIMDNPRKSRISKREAHKTAKLIVAQMKDKKLLKLRLRLVKAARAHDEAAEWKIVNLMRDYQKKEKLDK